MSKLIDLTGQKFGRLTVLERAEDYKTPKGKRHTRWMCKCECGNTAHILGDHLKGRLTKSCGCLSAELSAQRCKHHGYRERLYRIWTAMKQRCCNPKAHSYSRYGGRGITVCDEWMCDYKAFYDWALASGYQDDLSIDRIDNDKGYSPDNCRWATSKEQNRNRRINHNITINGETKTLAEWCEQYDISHKTVRSRLQLGWLPEEALGIVPRKKTE